MEASTPKDSLAAYVASLSDEDRAVLSASIAFASAVMAKADGVVDARELRMGELLQARAAEVLGSAFGRSVAASEPAAKAAQSVDWPQAPYLRQLEKLVMGMPSDAKKLYGDFVVELALAIGEATGGWLGFGDKLSGHEKYSARRLLGALALEPSDPHHRARLGY